MANALKVLDWASMDLGRLQRPDNWYRALHLFEELGDLTGQASVFNFLGGLAYFRGRWDEALDLYRRAQAMVRRTGNAVMDAFYMNNIGEIALEQGRLEQAAELFTEASRIWRAAGYRSGAASIKCNLGRVACGEGRYGDALRLFEESLAESEGVGGQVEALDTSARMAECMLLSGDADAARSLAEQALERSRALGGVAAQTPLLHRVRGVALLRAGDDTSAAAALEQSLEAGRARGADYEVALTLEALAELDEHTGVAARRVGTRREPRHPRAPRCRVDADPALAGLELTAPRPASDRRVRGASTVSISHRAHDGTAPRTRRHGRACTTGGTGRTLLEHSRGEAGARGGRAAVVGPWWWAPAATNSGARAGRPHFGLD